MSNTANKYWTRFVASALINAGVYVAYRLYMQHLKNQDKKEHDNTSTAQSKKSNKDKIEKHNYKTYRMQEAPPVTKKPRGRRPRVMNNGMANPVPKLRASKKNPIPGIKGEE